MVFWCHFLTDLSTKFLPEMFRHGNFLAVESEQTAGSEGLPHLRQFIVKRQRPARLRLNTTLDTRQLTDTLLRLKRMTTVTT
jgi:hypothetical protein